MCLFRFSGQRWSAVLIPQSFAAENALINCKTNAARLHYDANFFSNSVRKSNKKNGNISASFLRRRDILSDNDSGYSFSKKHLYSHRHE